MRTLRRLALLLIVAVLHGSADAERIDCYERGGGVAGSSPPVVASTVTAAFTASPVQGATCVAPCAVHVDAVATTDTDYTRVLHTHDFAWDYGDPGSGTWTTGAVTGASKDADSGIIAGHVYDTAGTYTITLTVTAPDGDTDTETANVTVANANTTFLTTATVCIAASTTPSAGSDGCPTDAAVVNVSTGYSGDLRLALAGSECDADNTGTAHRRCLLKHDDTFAFSAGTLALGNRSDPGLITKYGSGADPIIQFAAGSAISIASTWTVAQLDIQGDAASTTTGTITLTGSPNNVSILNNDFTANGYFAIDTATGATNAHPNLVAIMGNTIVSTPAQTNGMFIRADRPLIIGNSFDSNASGQFQFRSIHFARAAFMHNSMLDIATGMTNATFRAWSGATTNGPNVPSQYVQVSDNHFQAVNPTAAAITRFCEDNDCSGGGTGVGYRDVIYERNFHTITGTGATAGTMTGYQARDLTVRNNVIDWQGESGSSGGALTLVSMAASVEGLTQDNIHVLNNTGYIDAATTGTRATTMCAGTANVTSSLCYGNLIDNRGLSGTETQGDGANWTASGNVFATANPFASTPAAQGSTTPADFDIADGGQADDAGFDFASTAGSTEFVYEQFDTTVRPSLTTWDAGAWAVP